MDPYRRYATESYIREVLHKITPRSTYESEDRAVCAIARDVPEPVVMETLGRVQDARMWAMADLCRMPDAWCYFLSLIRRWERAQ